MVLFKETQKFNSPWLWLILCGLLALRITGKLVALSQSSIAEVVSLFVQDIGLWMLLLVIVFIGISKLKTEITDTGIQLSFFPLLGQRTYRWDELSAVYIRKYTISEFGGWGWRRSYGKNWAYTTSGKHGLQLIFKNGKKVLVGTHQVEALQELKLENYLGKPTEKEILSK